MKDPFEQHSERPWFRSLSIRIALPLDEDSSDSGLDYSEQKARLDSIHAARECQFTHCSVKSIKAIRRLPADAAIVLFTPFIAPAGSKTATAGDVNYADPFEPLGRELAKFHPNIEHVPYLPSVGFTDTHRGFVCRSHAIITVLCEPEHWTEAESINDQYDFATMAWKSTQPRSRKAPIETLLVRCGSDKVRSPAETVYDNLLDSPIYNVDMAKALARTIMGFS